MLFHITIETQDILEQKNGMFLNGKISHLTSTELSIIISLTENKLQGRKSSGALGVTNNEYSKNLGNTQNAQKHVKQCELPLVHALIS